MKHVKVFSKFNEDHSRPEFRKPKVVEYADCNKKLVNFGKASFTKAEKEFFDKFYEENINGGKIHSTEMFDKIFVIGIKLRGYYSGQIEITKLNDDWYLIVDYGYDNGSEYYICDEWEEVLGYLSTSKYGFRV
jgi:hypothetical protein